MGKKTTERWLGFFDWTSPGFNYLQTPTYLWLDLINIKKGSKFVEGTDTPPPKGNKRLTRTTCLGWYCTDAAWDYHFQISAGGASLEITSITTERLCFYFDEVNPWGWSGENSYAVYNNNYYYGGTFSVSWYSTSGPRSIHGLMNDFGFDKDGGTFLELLTQEGDKTINRFARQKDATCLHITIDRTYHPPVLTAKAWDWYEEGGQFILSATFDLDMDTTFNPTSADWTITLDGVEYAPTTAVWNGTDTIDFTVSPVTIPTSEIILTLNELNENLRSEISQLPVPAFVSVNLY